MKFCNRAPRWLLCIATVGLAACCAPKPSSRAGAVAPDAAVGPQAPVTPDAAVVPDAATPPASPTAATDCMRTGCGGEMCLPAATPMMSTCVFRAEHDCYKTAICTRQPNGMCGFTPDPAITACLTRARTTARPPSDAPQ